MAYQIEMDKQRTSHCSCCGNLTRTVWGFIYKDGDAFAIYYVIWTMAHIAEHGATFQLVLGDYKEGSRAEKRSLAELLYRPGESGGFMVVDAVADPTSTLYKQGIPRNAIIGTPLAQICFDLVDAIWLQDTRIAELKQ